MARRTLQLFLALLALSSWSCSSSTGNAGDAGSVHASDAASPGDVSPATGTCSEGPGEVFEKRVRPLIENDRPSSCSKCHVAGVDLGAFVTGDACGSMRCLVADGLVDLEQPGDSQILTFISRGYDAPDDSGVTNAMVREEYKGFLEWIEWASQCMDESCPETSTCSSRPETPLTDAGIGDDAGPPIPELNLANYPCGEAHQIQAFYDHAYPPEARCGHCHSPAGAIAGIGEAPLWMARNWDLAGAEETIRNMYALRAINLDEPRKSSVLLKPLHPDSGGIAHGGGSKFLDTEDKLYVALLTWIRMQRECRVSNAYPVTEKFNDEPKY